MGGPIRVTRRTACLLHLARPVQHGGQEGTRVVDRLPHRRSPDDRPAAADHLLRAEGGHAIERLAPPVPDVRVAHVRRGHGLHQVPAEADALLRQPDHQVAAGVAAPEELQLHHPVAQVDRPSAPRTSRSAASARDRLGALEQARHASLLAGPVLLSPLLDQVGRHAGRHDPPRAEGAGAQHPHGVVEWSGPGRRTAAGSASAPRRSSAGP